MYEQDQYDHEANGNGSFMLGLLCGAVVGAAAGMVWAPRAGSELRRELAGQAGKMKNGASDVYDRASDRVNNIVAKGRDVVEEGRQAYEHTANTVTSPR